MKEKDKLMKLKDQMLQLEEDLVKRESSAPETVVTACARIRGAAGQLNYAIEGLEELEQAEAGE